MSKDCQCTSCHSCIAYIAKTVIIVVGRWTFCDTWRVQNGIPQFGNFSFFESISGFGVCPSSLRRWSLYLLVGLTDPYNHTYSESLWWKLFKNHKRTQIQRQRQWQRQRQRQRHRQSAWKHNICYIFEILMTYLFQIWCRYLTLVTLFTPTKYCLDIFHPHHLSLTTLKTIIITIFWDIRELVHTKYWVPNHVGGAYGHKGTSST